jgi:hypothetical protein
MTGVGIGTQYLPSQSFGAVKKYALKPNKLQEAKQ